MAPPLKWAGGKRWLIPTLQKFWVGHAHRRLVEPFVGGMAVTLALQPHAALLNDLNPHLVNFYSWLSKGLTLTVPRDADAETFYANRSRFNDLVRTGKAGSKEAAMLFYYLNRNCYNGLCRFNKKGEFNTPHGRYANPQYVEDLSPYGEILRPWELQNGDFSAVALQPDDWLYADPPYDDAFTDYAAGGFGWQDQVRLANWLASHQGPVLASNHCTPRIVKLYQERGFAVHKLDAPRRISCTGDRTAVQEMLATRNLGCMPAGSEGVCPSCSLIQLGSVA